MSFALNSAVNSSRISAMPGAMAGANFAKVNGRKTDAPMGSPAALNAMKRITGGADDDLGFLDQLNKAKARSAGINDANMAGVLGLNAMAKAQAPTTEQLDKDEARKKQVTDYAQQLVSQVFYGTLLKQMRESPFKSEIFSGGRGGQAYSALYDQTLSEKASKASGNKLTRAIVKSMLKKDAAKAPADKRAIPGSTALVPDAASRAQNSFANVRVHVAPNLRH